MLLLDQRPMNWISGKAQPHQRPLWFTLVDENLYRRGLLRKASKGDVSAQWRLVLKEALLLGQHLGPEFL